jgi:hypothetical protein
MKQQSILVNAITAKVHILQTGGNEFEQTNQ